ncbi:MAG: sugar ABC transporter ATP-binding protein [Lachnospiraceae bacterium]|nr:sugar ABC transporter ATP-binding protein [Lachnospiraceae bacterium]
MSETILTVKGMNKSFGPTRALSNVDFELKRGEVHGLIGENGSGKSTLTSIIAGIQPADSGEMRYKGNLYDPGSVVKAMGEGIAMIVQEMGTAGSISVAENLFMGNLSGFSKASFVNKKAMMETAGKALEAVGIRDIKAQMMTGSLDPESRKKVEIAKAMMIDPEVLIVDETTTALSQDGREILYSCIDKMRSENKAVIMISHDLDEIMEICSVVTVLRDGNIIGTLQKEEFDTEKIKTMMVGREIRGDLYRSDFDRRVSDEVVLSARDISGAWQISDVSLELHKGEILGIGGIASGGIHELGRLLFGIDKTALGTVVLGDGTKVSNPRVAVKHKMGYVSKNRDEESLMLDTTIKNNLVLPALSRIAKGGIFIYGGSEKEIASKIIEEMSVKCQSQDAPIRSLSGGNKQKVSFGKWLGCGTEILILDCPTRGIDIGVKQAMYQMIYQLKKEGISFILISEELQELIGMSDRILILKDGRITGEYERSPELNEHDLVKVMV